MPHRRPRPSALAATTSTVTALALTLAGCGSGAVSALPTSPVTPSSTTTTRVATTTTSTSSTTTTPVPTTTSTPPPKATTSAKPKVVVTARPTPKPVVTPTPRRTTPAPPPPPPPPPVTTPQTSAAWVTCQPVLAGIRLTVDATQRTVTIVNGNGGSFATVSFHVRTDTACGFVQKFADSGGRVGYGGISDGATRRQGTGTTPSGTYTMSEAFGLSGNPGTRLPYRTAGPGDFWVEDNDSAYYNSFRNEAQGGFDATLPLSDDNGSERLTDYPGQYAYAIVVNFNRAPDRRTPYRGAGIFVHVRGSGATAGCVSLSQGEILTMLAYLRPGDTITIVP